MKGLRLQTRFQSQLSDNFVFIQAFVTVSGPTTALWLYFIHVRRLVCEVTHSPFIQLAGAYPRADSVKVRGLSKK
jgi:hypothetical protein